MYFEQISPIWSTLTVRKLSYHLSTLNSYKVVNFRFILTSYYFFQNNMITTDSRFSPGFSKQNECLHTQLLQLNSTNNTLRLDGQKTYKTSQPWNKIVTKWFFETPNELNYNSLFVNGIHAYKVQNFFHTQTDRQTNTTYNQIVIQKVSTRAWLCLILLKLYWLNIIDFCPISQTMLLPW